VELIQVKEVSKAYRKTPVLKNVNLTVTEGDLLGIIGQSGSGKSTLLNLMTGFIRPSEGNVFYSAATGDKKELHKHLPKIKKHLGYTPHHNSFYPQLTIAENLFHFGRLYGLSKPTIKHNMEGLLAFTKLTGHEKKLAGQLSEGMQRRLEICCSLIHKPKVLVLDEPTIDLDPMLEQEILHLLQDINKQGVTIVVASHHLNSIEKICNKVAVIKDGTVHTHGLLDDVKKSYAKDHFTISLHHKKRKPELIAKLKSLPVEKMVDHGNRLEIYPNNVESAVRSVVKLVEDEDLHIRDMDVRSPSLNEVFEKIHE
jgi:ABC-2 type transport system ATP-binding protein